MTFPDPGNWSPLRFLYTIKNLKYISAVHSKNLNWSFSYKYLQYCLLFKGTYALSKNVLIVAHIKTTDLAQWAFISDVPIGFQIANKKQGGAQKLKKGSQRMGAGRNSLRISAPLPLINSISNEITFSLIHLAGQTTTEIVAIFV